MPHDSNGASDRLLADPTLGLAFRADLERQAETLIVRRLHEVAMLPPESFEALGPGAPRLYRIGARTPGSQGHRRHLEDAIVFGRRLEGAGLGVIRRSELRRLKFERDGRRWAVRFVLGAWLDGRRRAALLVLCRSRAGQGRSGAVDFGTPGSGARR